MLWSGPVWIWWARAMCCLSAHGLAWVLAGQRRWMVGLGFGLLTVLSLLRTSEERMSAPLDTVLHLETELVYSWLPTEWERRVEQWVLWSDPQARAAVLSLGAEPVEVTSGPHSACVVVTQGYGIPDWGCD